MNKFLSTLLVVGMTTTAFSQTIWSDNFESYNTGNLGTQGGWARYENSGSAAWTQVANIDAAHGKSLKLASPASNSDGAWHFHDTNWSTRTSGNNVFFVEFDYYTGTAGTGAGIVQIYDIPAGEELIFETGWVPDQNYIYVANADDGGILVEDPTPNTWYHIKASYDYNTGEIKAQATGSEVFEFYGAAGFDPTEFDVLLSGATTSGFDNIVTGAYAESPLAVSDVVKKSSISVYPNPATDFVTVKSANKIAEITVYDVSGKVVKTTTETTVNVQNFAKGAYILNIKYADGTKESTKVIKK